MRGRLWLCIVLAVWFVCGCSSNQNLELVNAPVPPPQEVDAAPIDLLPSEPLIIGKLQANALFQSGMGGQLEQLIRKLLPLGPESNFVPRRDVSQVFAAGYAMQGADFCAVLQGNFDIASIQRAAAAQQRTPTGAALVRTQYGRFTIFTGGNVGFVVLTQRTILSGNETGLRRALDRMRYGWTDTVIEPWMRELLNTENAGFAMVGDVSSQGVVSAASANYPFLHDLRLLRVVGNFQPPGMNVAGSLTYGNAQSARVGAAGLSQVQQLASFASLLTSFGFGGQLPPLEVAEQGNNVAFAQQVDTNTANLFLSLLSGLILPK